MRCFIFRVKNSVFKLLEFKVLIVLIAMLCFNFLESQNQQLELKISNDKIVFLDRYYTNGIHLTYRRKIEKALVFSKRDNNELLLNVTLGNETYTPKNLTSFNNRDFDRPYAGWLFFNFEIGRIKHKSALFIALESGITGEESLAGKLQTRFHELLRIESMPTWADEIAFNWLFNLKLNQIQEFKINKSSSLQNRIGASLGSKDTFIKNEVYYFIGKFNDFKNSSRINQITSKTSNEFYGFASVGYKYVLLNSLIQGSPFSNNDPFTTLATSHILNFKSGIVLKFKKNIFAFNYNYNTKETPLSVSHSYGSLTYAFSF